MSGQDNDNKTILGKTLTYPQKVALVKSGQGVTVSSGQVTTDGKTTTVSAVGQQPPQGATTYRTINQPQMRLVMPASGTVPAPQIIQTHLMPQAMLKSGRLLIRDSSHQLWFFLHFPLDFLFVSFFLYHLPWFPDNSSPFV